ncbi:MAG: NADP-dependent phosphogluconate dehydrogenase [Alphaproteobacteria bacterium]|nr:NADP-dependent phosphogluconate dehydrogenase [Alphaproteobacteria bacterium]
MARIGLTGLGTMGAALSLNIAEKGFEIAVHNRSEGRTQALMERAGDLAARMTPTANLAELVAAIEPPRAVIVMVPAGAPVDAVIEKLLEHLETGDMIVDAGNADFHDTRRREAALAEREIGFVGMGVSGGEEGARHGPSIMVGGPEASYARLEEIVEAIAAKYQGAPCAAHLGPDGAGHFVKTVHNGIEYADMQLIAEVYGMLRYGQGRKPAQMAELFEVWNGGPLHSYLVEITAEVLAATDPETGAPMVDVILDRAGQKGTGRWTLIEALGLGQSATTIEAAVAARSWSSAKEAREAGAQILAAPKEKCRPVLDTDLEEALLAARIIAYGQGMSLLAAASEEYGWDLDLAQVAEIWRAGCIIRSSLLDEIASAVRAGLPHQMLIFAPGPAERLAQCVPALRRVVATGVAGGLPMPAMAAALGMYDTMRTARGTTDLIQAQRDFFGAHGFERVDAEGAHHGPWGAR